MKKYPLIPFILLPLLTTACGKESQKSALFSSTELRMERIETVAATPDQCVNGGSELRTYLDLNANSQRDEDESILSSFVVCSGTNGKDGMNGQDGQNGSDGKDGADGNDGVDGQNGRPAYIVVYQTSNVAPSCANGGSTITFGLDVNENGALDSEDSQIQSMVICNGNDGTIVEVPAPTPATHTCKVSVKHSSSWNEGYVDEVTIQYFGDDISSWTAEFELPDGHTLTNLWDAATSDKKNHITAKSFLYNGYVKNGWKITFGFQASRADAKFPEESSYRLNGVVCK